MRIPFWDSAITLYQRKTENNGTVTWTRSTHKGCFWKQTAGRNRSNGAETGTTSIICRIPSPYPEVKVGDIVVYGNVTDTIDEYAAGKRSIDLMEKYAGSCVLVAEVRQNTRGLAGVDHLYVGG